MRIRTFQGLRPNLPVAEKITSPPHDVVSTEEARFLAKGNPLNMLNIVRPEINFPEGTDPYSDPVYALAVENFQMLQREGHLVRETKPCLYLYRQKMGNHVQDGLVAVCNVEDYENNLIKKHEKTRKDKEDDRTRLTSEMNANAGPIFLTYSDNEAVDKLLAPFTQDKPLYELTAEDGIQHTVWRITDTDKIIESFNAVPCAYIADGHHRSASAARVARERIQTNSDHTGKEDYNWFLCVLFPASQLQILPYNRVIKDLNGYTSAQFLEAIQSQGIKWHKNAAPSPDRAGFVHLYFDKEWYSLELTLPSNEDPISMLDVSILQDKILDPLLGIKDPRTDKRIDFIGGIRGTSALEKKVDSGDAAVAFSLYPVSIEQLMMIADADQIMPPKSTWFEPKLRTGFFIHTF